MKKRLYLNETNVFELNLKDVIIYIDIELAKNYGEFMRFVAPFECENITSDLNICYRNIVFKRFGDLVLTPNIFIKGFMLDVCCLYVMD